MKSLALAIAALALFSLAACNQRPAQSEKTAVKTDNTPLADAGSKVPPSEPFKSAVTGKPATGSPQAADAELSRKVKNALSTATDISTGGLEVASTDGVVTLYGTVDAPVEKDRAAMYAMEVDGVRSVVNNLVVVKGS